jgi:hypothetical protein
VRHGSGGDLDERLELAAQHADRARRLVCCLAIRRGHSLGVHRRLLRRTVRAFRSPPLAATAAPLAMRRRWRGAGGNREQTLPANANANAAPIFRSQRCPNSAFHSGCRVLRRQVNAATLLDLCVAHYALHACMRSGEFKRYKRRGRCSHSGADRPERIGVAEGLEHRVHVARVAEVAQA